MIIKVGTGDNSYKKAAYFGELYQMRYKKIIAVVVISISLAVLCWYVVGFLFARHLLLSLQHDFNSDPKKMNAVMISIILESGKYLSDDNKIDFSRINDQDIMYILFIKGMIKKYYRNQKVLPNDINVIASGEKDPLIKDHFGNVFYYKPLENNWVIVGSNGKNNQNKIDEKAITGKPQILLIDDGMYLVFQINLQNKPLIQ